MALAYEQSRLTYGTGDTVALAYTNNVKASSLLVIVITQWRDGGVSADSTVSDSQGNTYAKVGNRVTTTGGMCIEMFWAAAGSAAANTVTVNPQGTSTSLAIHEFSGTATTSPINVQDTNTGNNGSCSGGPVTTTIADTVLFGGMTSEAQDFAPGIGGSESITKDADYTELQTYKDGDTYAVVHTQYRIVSSTLTDTANWTLGGTWKWAGWVVAFKILPVVTTSFPDSPSSRRFLHILVR